MAAASRKDLKSAGLVALIFGILLLGLGSEAIVRYFSRLPAQRVANCNVFQSHGPHLNLAFEDGTGLALSFQDIRNSDKCLDRGTIVEKRRSEFGIRLNGKSQDWGQRETSLSFLVFGLIMSIGGGALLLRSRSTVKQ